jgi:MFS family permease
VDKPSRIASLPSNTGGPPTYMTKLALLLVVLVDVMGQGLMFPILNTLMMDPDQAFLPAGTPMSTRHFNYGLVISIFFLSWFLGAAYVSKLSDMIGRKNGIQICLAGAFAGYALTIAALYANSLWLLILSRVVTGFTAGNQPIAQAAMVDLSADDEEKTRNLGYIVSGLSVGLVAGPIIGGVLSDPNLLGGFASLSLPFYAGGLLILATMFLIAVFFRDSRQERAPLRFEPLEIFLVLWRIAERPAILRISLVFFCYMFVLNSFFVFMDNYLTSRFQFGTFMNSVAMMIFGICLALSGAFLVSVFDSRFTRRNIVVAALLVISVSCVAFAVVPVAYLTFVPIVVIGITFSIGYPTLLSIYSLSVDETEQGWVMGVTTALFTLAAGITSFVGGEAMGIDIGLPFYYAAAVAALAVILIAAFWSYPVVRAVVLAKPEGK